MHTVQVKQFPELSKYTGMLERNFYIEGQKLSKTV